jgi:hypothetical protein
MTRRHHGMSYPPGLAQLLAGHRNTLGRNPSLERFRQHRVMLNIRLRAAYVAGCEQRSIVERGRGRGLTEEEVRAALVGYPGDLPTTR